VSNAVLEVCTPLFQLVPSLRQTSEATEAKALRAKVLDTFEAVRLKGTSQGIQPELWQEIQFVMAAFLDELILNNPEHELHQTWSREPLQWIFFKEHLAGETFFEKLFHLKRYSHQHLPLLELYYWCLMLGYKGKYHQDQKAEEELDHIREALKGILEKQLPDKQVLYGFQDLNVNVGANTQKLKRRTWLSPTVLMGIGILMIPLVYVAMGHRVQVQTKTLETQLKSMKLLR